MTSDFSESLLSKRFGSETVNFFAGSKLNRYSFKRTEHKFLSQSLLHPTTRFVAFNNLDPLADKSGRVKFLSYDEVKEIIGNPYEHPDDVRLRQWCSSDQEVILIYLGCDESHDTDVKGLPYFAVDVTPAPMSREAEKTAFIEAQTGKGLEFRNVRVGVELEHEEAAIVAMGRSLIDWNVRYIHCPGCGGKTLGVWAGAKRQCPEIDKVAGPRAPCVSRKGLHNYAYPRTDAVIIMGILSADGEKLLMGRQKVWPKGMYSCLAGFIEPGESLEEAVRREVWEESGVKVGRVQYHSSQPWPFPSQLMIGTIGQALEGSVINLGFDPELEDARWFTKQEIKDAGIMGVEGYGDTDKEFKIPPEMAIANKLVKCFAEDHWELERIK